MPRCGQPISPGKRRLPVDDAQHAFWTGYVRDLADSLGLKDWDISIWRDVTNSGIGGRITCVSGRKQGCIELGHSFFQSSPDQQRHILIHELLHCHLDPIDTAICHAKAHNDSETIAVLHSTVHTEIEFAVDGITAAIASRYPVPDTS